MRIARRMVHDLCAAALRAPTSIHPLQAEPRTWRLVYSLLSSELMLTSFPVDAER